MLLVLRRKGLKRCDTRGPSSSQLRPSVSLLWSAWRRRPGPLHRFRSRSPSRSTSRPASTPSRRRARSARRGTFEDTVATFAGVRSGQPKVNLLITTVYTCDDGSGTFDMLKHVFITVNPDGSFSNTGPVQILGGTGAYAGLI